MKSFVSMMVHLTNRNKSFKNTARNINILNFFKKNDGVSSARNRGLLIAKGTYIWFVSISYTSKMLLLHYTSNTF